eukprot:gene4382-4427_t
MSLATATNAFDRALPSVPIALSAARETSTASSAYSTAVAASRGSVLKRIDPESLRP